MHYNFSGANRWPNPEKTDIQVTVNNTSCGSMPSVHYFMGEGERFGLSWNPCFTQGSPDCKPFMEVPTAEEVGWMSFAGLNDSVAGEWISTPRYFAPPNDYSKGVLTGPPCRMYSKLQEACGGRACWRLPGQPQNFFNSAADCSGVGGARGFDWCAVTDLCFAANATSAGVLQPRESQARK